MLFKFCDFDMQFYLGIHFTSTLCLSTWMTIKHGRERESTKDGTWPRSKMATNIVIWPMTYWLQIVHTFRQSLNRLFNLKWEITPFHTTANLGQVSFLYIISLVLALIRNTILNVDKQTHTYRWEPFTSSTFTVALPLYNLLI